MGGLKVFIAMEPCDMRKGFEGLHAAVSERLKEDVRSGALFDFTNKRHTRLKVLYFDGSGLWLMTKRLEKGTFAWPRTAESGQTKLQLAPEAFALLTDGIDMHKATMRPWYGRAWKKSPLIIKITLSWFAICSASCHHDDTAGSPTH